MNPREFMLVDLQHRGSSRMFITERVDKVRTDKGMYVVTFSGQPKPFSYRKERLLVLTKPKKVDLEGRGLYIRKKHITDATEVYKFGDGDYTFWHIVCDSGYYMNEDGRHVYQSRTPINMGNTNLWKFLIHVVEETGIELKPKGSDESLNLLQLQYNLIDINRDNVPLANYLGVNRTIGRAPLPRQIIYPFGCNASQKKAVENALSHQISIIQGPPGTGKTQTILNIIANLLVEKKSVLIVSNNNSAVDNVAEKLSSEKIGLGFLVAKLGSVENRTRFLEHQPAYPDITGWQVEDERKVKQVIDSALNIVSKGFEKQTRLSELRTELVSLETEQHYNEGLSQEGIQGGKWLATKPSRKLMKLLAQLQRLSDEDKKMPIIARIRWTLSLGLRTWKLLGQDAKNYIEEAYYSARRREIEKEIENNEVFLKENNISQNVEVLRCQSLRLLKSEIYKKYRGSIRPQFERNTIKRNSEKFLEEYPVVLSTTYSAKSNISKDMVFDYVIMDEASQVDIATGALALSCAENVVIVGDDKQLPNVIDEKTFQVLTDIEDAHDIENKYRMTTHSFLQSCNEVFPNAPTTLLREHYRCQPKIIEFCNKMFYDGELLTMTSDNGDPKTLSVVRTVPGNHARGHVNQREIDVIVQEAMPIIAVGESVGIITPYRDQASAINKQLHREIASTVHKYQGRECDTIVMSMVDNQPTSFSDDSNLLNVAISRAKSKLCVVMTGNDLPKDSIISQLIGYIRYNNFDVKESGLRSVFDILYEQYTQERLKFERKQGKGLGELSENIIYNAIIKAMKVGGTKNVAVLDHYPLSRLIPQDNSLDEEKKNFVNSPYSHVDFLLYNTITKQPMLCVEVDGWKNHNTEVQRHRDNIKDEILEQYGLKLVRLLTTQVVTVETIKEMLDAQLSVTKYPQY